MNVFLASPWVPPEWVKAHGLKPRAVVSLPPVSGTAPSAGACAHAETVLLQAQSQAAGAFVFTTHCDQLRRSFDALVCGPSDHAFLFNLPSTSGPGTAQRLFNAELERLSRWLVKLGGSAPGGDALLEVLQEYEVCRQMLGAAASWCSGRTYARALLQYYSDETTALREPLSPPSDTRPQLVPLALLGGPFGPSCWSLLDEIERAGGRVVLNATDYGERGLGIAVRGTLTRWAVDPDPESLNRLFLDRIVDVFQRPNDRLYEWLGERIQQRRVRGIVLRQFVGCDLWRAELQTLEDRFHVPVLMLESDGTGDGSVRTITRIQAFLESLRQRKGGS